MNKLTATVAVLLATGMSTHANAQQQWGAAPVAASASRAEVTSDDPLADHSSAVAATATQLRRLKAVAMPLIHTLDDNQKREAIAFARALGFQQLVAAF
jgi:hypothetical protein